MEGFEKILEDDEGNLYVDEYELGEGIETNLVIDSKTKVMYYMLSDYSVGLPGNNVGYMSPYISENGKFCRFIDNQIVEIG